MLFARQGFTHPIVLRLRGGADGRFRAMALPEVDSERLPDFWNLDLRVAKQIRIGGEVRLTVSGEVFNTFNSNTVLNRNREATSGVFDRLDELPNPRIIRLGAQLRF